MRFYDIIAKLTIRIVTILMIVGLGLCWSKLFEALLILVSYPFGLNWLMDSISLTKYVKNLYLQEKGRSSSPDNYKRWFDARIPCEGE